MKIIEPSVELIDEINTDAVYKKIERCGRVCYQSEPKGEPEKFIRARIKNGHESVLEHVSLTFRIICDRAIIAELTRHRLASFSVESTRFFYKYNELTIISPFYNDPVGNFIFRNAASTSEETYSRWIIGKTATPEQARAILPLCLKTELYMTANLREWRHILKLRTAKNAHPQMRFIAGKILDTFKEKLPVIVEDLS